MLMQNKLNAFVNLWRGNRLQHKNRSVRMCLCFEKHIVAQIADILSCRKSSSCDKCHDCSVTLRQAVLSALMYNDSGVGTTNWNGSINNFMSYIVILSSKCVYYWTKCEMGSGDSRVW